MIWVDLVKFNGMTTDKYDITVGEAHFKLAFNCTYHHGYAWYSFE